MLRPPPGERSASRGPDSGGRTYPLFKHDPGRDDPCPPHSRFHGCGFVEWPDPPADLAVMCYPSETANLFAPDTDKT